MKDESHEDSSALANLAELLILRSLLKVVALNGGFLCDA